MTALFLGSSNVSRALNACRKLFFDTTFFIFFRYHFFPNEQRGGIRGFGEPPASRRPDNGGGRHDWGRGHVLGDN
jgi:hypothetical protein